MGNTNNPLPTLNVMEIFTSTQGEGIQAGIKTTFVRMGGCNAACSWCDEPDSIPLKRPATEKMSVAEVMNIVSMDNVNVVCLTGGEPTIQPVDTLTELCIQLKRKKHFICIETNAKHILLGLVPYMDLWTLSPKLGSSENQQQIKTLIANVEKLNNAVEAECQQIQLKFVVGTVDDALEMRHYLEAFPTIQTSVNSVWDEKLFQPKYSMKELQAMLEAAQIEFHHRSDFRIGIQLHKTWGLH